MPVPRVLLPALLFLVGLGAIVGAWFLPRPGGEVRPESGSSARHSERADEKDALVLLHGVTEASEELVLAATRGKRDLEEMRKVVKSLLEVGERLMRPFSPEIRSSLLVPVFNLRRAADLIGPGERGGREAGFDEAFMTVKILSEVLDQPAAGAKEVLERAADDYSGANCEEAMERCLVLESMGPANVRFPARFLRGLCLFRNGRLEEGSRLLLELAENDKRNNLAAQALLWAGIGFYCEGKLVLCSEIFKAVGERYPGTLEGQKARKAFSALERTSLETPYLHPVDEGEW